MSLSAQLSLSGCSPHIVVEGFRLRATFNQPWEVSIDARIADDALDLSAVMGEPATLSLPEEPRLQSLAGLVTRVEQRSSNAHGLSSYEIMVAPALWLLGQGCEHRIFQDTSPQALFRQLAEASGETTRLDLSEPPKDREYIVQYGESDLAFLQRLAAEEGLLFYWDMATGELVLHDDSRAALGEKVSWAYRHGVLHERRGEPSISRMGRNAMLAAARIARSDYDPLRPKLSLLARSEQKGDLFSREAELEHHAHDPGQFAAESDGKRLALLELEAKRAHARAYRLGSTALLLPGDELLVTEAPFEDAAAGLLVSAVEAHYQRGNESRVATIASDLTATPKALPFRLPRLPKPRVAGTHTATVVGEAGQEIDVDEAGRVVLAFSWDRRVIADGAPTRRVRVSQAWAGPGYGLMALPRIGDEVLVSFLDGDPDEPVVVGRVHNAKNVPPLKLPDEKTRSIWRTKSSPGGNGANHLLLEDQAGKELVEIFAQKDVRIHAQNESDFVYGKNARETVGANKDIHVKGDQAVTVDGALSTTVGATYVEKCADYTLDSGPINLSGTRIGVAGSVQITAESPVIGLHGLAKVFAMGTEVTCQAFARATVTSPMSVVEGHAIAAVKGTMVIVDGVTVTISGSGKVAISSGSEVTVSAPTVNVSGSTINASGGAVNVAGSAVNVKGGTVNIN